MTAFYMFRLMSLTFFGNYRGPAWETAGHGHAGHGVWHGPHDAPKPMTFALVVLAVGAVLAGLVGVPTALGGGNAIEHFLHPSFVAGHPIASAIHVVAAPLAVEVSAGSQEAAASATHAAPAEQEPAAELSHTGELVLMGFSVLIGVIGIAVAYRIYVRRPEIAATLKARFAGPHRVLTNKYYVDELYGATVIRGTMASANGLWTFDRNVVDGAVNGSGALTRVTSWLSGLLDKYIVDGLVNLVGSILQESSFIFRRLQTGLIQNYALLMLFGVFAFVSLYLVLGR
jgi:NADH-quinone oxidoreductase subunit L